MRNAHAWSAQRFMEYDSRGVAKAFPFEMKPVCIKRKEKKQVSGASVKSAVLDL